MRAAAARAGRSEAGKVGAMLSLMARSGPLMGVETVCLSAGSPQTSGTQGSSRSHHASLVTAGLRRPHELLADPSAVRHNSSVTFRVLLKEMYLNLERQCKSSRHRIVGTPMRITCITSRPARGIADCEVCHGGPSRCLKKPYHQLQKLITQCISWFDQAPGQLLNSRHCSSSGNAVIKQTSRFALSLGYILLAVSVSVTSQGLRMGLWYCVCSSQGDRKMLCPFACGQDTASAVLNLL